MSDIALHFDARPEGIPLVLLPAFPLDGRMFRGVRRYLDGWVITADPPGFGDSAPPRAVSAHLGEPAGPSLETYARAVARALDEVGAGRIVLAGVSIGGYATMAFAEIFPERLAGIGLLDTKAESDDIEMREYRLRMADAMSANEPTVRFLAPLLDHVVSPFTKRERRTPSRGSPSASSRPGRGDRLGPACHGGPAGPARGPAPAPHPGTRPPR